jgi:hypothetical protein
VDVAAFGDGSGIDVEEDSEVVDEEDSVEESTAVSQREVL